MTMIDKSLVRKGNREKDLLDNLLSYSQQYRSSFEDGGPVAPPAPINLDEYLELGVKIANMTESERASLEFMLKKLGAKKK